MIALAYMAYLVWKGAALSGDESGLDWSTVPAGATHYYAGSPSPWRDLSAKDWKWWHEGTWHSPHEDRYAAFCRNLDLSSAGLLARNAHNLIARP